MFHAAIPVNEPFYSIANHSNNRLASFAKSPIEFTRNESATGLDFNSVKAGGKGARFIQC